MAGPAHPSDFTFVNNMGTNDGGPLLTSGGTYGAMSTNHGDGSAIFDGRISVWSTHAYRGPGSPAGMEIRFHRPTHIDEFTVTCIYQSQSDLNNDICYSAGGYDMKNFNVDYWDGAAWQAAYRFDGDSNGQLFGSTAALAPNAFSTSWRFWAIANAHMNNNYLHLSEIEITNIWEEGCCGTPHARARACTHPGYISS